MIGDTKTVVELMTALREMSDAHADAMRHIEQLTAVCIELKRQLNARDLEISELKGSKR